MAMKQHKKGSYSYKSEKSDLRFNLYIVQSESGSFYLAYDADPFYGGYAFEFDNDGTHKTLNDAVQFAQKKYINRDLVWIK